MTFWLVGDEEYADPRFTTGSLGLYVRAGSWCMGQIRYRPFTEIPAEWLVPTNLVRGWNAVRLANELVEQGLWTPCERAHGVWATCGSGWHFAWIRPHNTAKYMRDERGRQSRKKANQRKTVSPEDIEECPPGTQVHVPGWTYTGDMGGESVSCLPSGNGKKTP